MVRAAPSLEGGKVRPRHCHGGVGYIVFVAGDGQDTNVEVSYDHVASGVGTE